VCSSTLFIIAQLRPQPVARVTVDQGRGSGSLAASTWPVQLGSLLMGAGLGVMFTFVQPFALEQGAQKVGQLFLGYAAAATAVRVFLGGVSDRAGSARVAAAALGLYACTVLATSQLTPEILVYLGISLGLSHGFLYPALTAAGLCHVHRQNRGKFLGWMAFCFNAGFALTVLLLGPCADRFGYPPIFIVAGLCLTLGVIPLARFARPAQLIAP